MAGLVVASGLLAAGAVAAVQREGASLPAVGPLGGITEPGDGCPQMVSAIGYADALLVDLGQERYQEYDVAVRSRLAQVAGTARVEAADWPSERVHRQARQLAHLAFTASRLPTGGEAAFTRAQALVAYKAGAAQMVLLCQAVAG